MDRGSTSRSPGISPASSLTSLSGSFSLDSSGPLSPRSSQEGLPSGRRNSRDGGSNRGGGVGIQMQIQQLQDEQERVQKKTFTNWMNTYLKQRSPPMKVENLFEDIKDGVVLLSLLEVLSGDKLQMERGKLKRVHYVSNLSTALKFLEGKKIKLVNINVSDIADGKPSIVLGLIWTIILYFQIEDTLSQQATMPADEEGGPPKKLSALDKFRMNAKKALLAWTGNAITKRYGIEINDFGKSWRDGLAFSAMVHTIRPDLVDMDKIRKQSARVNLENAFSTAEKHLGIARLLDPEDVDVEKPDERSVMTYVAQFLKAYPEAGEDPALGRKIKTPAEQEMAEYTELMQWLTEEADEVLKIVEEPVTDRLQEYMDYLAFKLEVDRREQTYIKIGEKIQTGQTTRLTKDNWQQLDTEWRKMARKTRMWLWKLDANLPGKLGQFGDWLNQAEEILAQEEDILENPEEMAFQLGKILQEHRVFFKDIEGHKKFFLQVKRAGKYEGESIPGPQLENLAARLQVVCKQAPLREYRLEYEQLKYRLLAFLVAAEAKLRIWTVKHGRQESVEELLVDYQTFVLHGKLFQNYDKTYEECKAKAETYRKQGTDKNEVDKMNIYFDEVTSRWKKVSVEVKSVQSMLEEVIDSWKKYNSILDTLTGWLGEAEEMMKSRSTEEKKQFFADMGPYEEKLKIINEAGQFLIETCDEPIAAEIRQTLQKINKRFSDLSDKHQHFQQVEVIGKARKEYQDGIMRLTQWLKNAEELMVHEVPCRHADLKEHLNQLDTFGNQLPSVESDFKVTTKTAQSLVKDSTQDIVTDMLQTLNVQKEVIVQLRKEIPERIKQVKAMLPNIESLETGILDLLAWIEKGEALLATHKLDGTQEECESRLEKHKALFSEVTYQKSILESKNKVYQKVSSIKPKLKNVNYALVDEPMEQLNERFMACVSSSKNWEKNLDNLSRLWRTHQQKQQVLENWLAQAEAVLDDTDDDRRSQLKKHKQFFTRVEDRLPQEYQRACQDILMVLEEEDRPPLTESMKHTLARWKAVTENAPVKLIKLEFSLEEDEFCKNMENAEKTVNMHNQTLARNENVKETLIKHRQMFHDGDFQKTIAKSLDTMGDLCNQLAQHDKRDHSLRELYQEHMERWKKLKTALDATLLGLKQLPERWKEYNAKLEEFGNFVQTVEGLIQDLQKENLTSDEYKELQSKFQKSMRNMNKYTDDAKWLQENLEELLRDSPETDKTREKKKLSELVSRFSGLTPHMDKTSEKSALFSKAYDFRDNIEKRSSWLDEAHRLVMDNPFIDGLEDARAFLQEHEGFMDKLEAEKANILVEIEAGRRLQQDKNAPKFIVKSLQDMERKLKDTDQLAAAKHTKLKQKVQEWENYEKERANLVQYLKKAEEELEQPPAAAGQDHAQKDLQSKKELQNTLKKLKGSLNEMQKLNAILCEGASRERRGPLKGEMTDIDKRLENVSVRLNAKLADLEATIAKWTEYYKRLNNFCDWLNEKEQKLNEVYENKNDTPDQQLEKANAIASEVYENHITLETLEKDAKGLSQNFRSRETAALKSKLMTVRRQWDSLCARAKDRSTALTGSVAHWQMYQNLSQQLMPWIVKAEKYCATDLPKCSDLQEAKDIYDLHQEFLQECETQLPIFEKMSTEAGYIMDQPNMQRDLDALQRRWNSILSASEERSHRVDKIYGAWTAYNQELNNINEVMEKFENRLAVEPNINSTDPQVLEHELVLCKTLQEEIRSQQPQLNALQRQFEQVKQHATPEGLKDLKDRQDAVKAKWNKVMTDATERQGMLNAAVKHRQDFYARLQDFEKWLKKTQRKLDTGSEIYSDEVGETMQKLKALRNECAQQDPMYNALVQEFKDLLQNCNEDERAILSDRFDRIDSGYSTMEDLIKSREDLCQHWDKYQTVHRDAQGKLKTIQAKLASPNIKEEEVVKANQEIQALRADMAKWAKEADSLDDLMATAQLTIKDRATQRTLHFGSELQVLESMCDSAAFSAKQKEEHLGELSQLCQEFEVKKGGLVGKLADIVQRLQEATVEQSSPQGLRDLVREIEDIRDDVFAYNPEYEQLRELGRQIMQADPSRSSTVQGSLSKVNDAWDTVQALLGEKHQQYSSVASMWQQYMDAKQGVVRVLEDVQPLVEQDIAFSSQPDVKKALDQHKNAEFELHSNQSQLDLMNSKGLQLLSDLKNIPNFDMSVLEEDLDEINHKWESANSDIEQHKENLEAQLVCWDQVQTGTEELESWVNTMVTKLDDCLQHFDDAVTVEACLTKFKEEAPYYEEVLKEINQKIKDLREMNQDQEISELVKVRDAITDKFEKATSLANQLEGVMANFADERQNLEKAIEEETEWINQVKEMLAKCDDVSGADEDIVQRLETAKVLKDQLAEHKKKIGALLDKASAMQAKYPSAETANLAKDAGVLKKKFEGLMNRGDKIEEMLQGTLEQHCQDAQQQQQRWLNTAREKVTWCGDIAGDRYSVEAKLATIKDLIASAKEGQQKKELAEGKVETVKGVLPRQKQAELEQQKKAADKEWAELMDVMQKTQAKLEGSIDQWSAYDREYENLSQWLKDTETSVRNEGNLQPDLPSKIEQYEHFKEIDDDVKVHKAAFDQVRDSAQEITRATGDGRTTSYAGQLLTRYNILAAAVKEQVERCEQNIEDHEDYMNKYKSCLDWLQGGQQELDECSDLPRDNEALEAKLSTVQDLNARLEKGTAIFNNALEAGERLYPNTSNEGREAIRRDLRSLREKWEQFNDHLNETQRNLESSRMQWSTFDENFDQLQKWTEDMNKQIEEDMDMKTSLQEKKACLQHYRVSISLDCHR
ncbi:hypothetical protein ACJMK2_037885 [Sinanodonta woodiana]|uniref:Uncharacterized protein n=1 Tax=Sinanodonta woodiana TaxID=1069815 RepID=A0ABD3WQB7_SINWO